TACSPERAADSSTFATSPAAPSAGLNCAASSRSPVRTSSADIARTAASSGSGTPRSYTTWSALRSASCARRVSSPGSPGPAPTKLTCPANLRVRLIVYSQYCFGTGVEQILRQLASDRSGVGERSGATQADGYPSVRAQYRTAQMNLSRVSGVRPAGRAVHHGESGDRRRAAGLQPGQQRPL